MNAKSEAKSTRERLTVAKYIGQQLALSERSQKEIAAEIGYDRPNFLTMVKSGQSKLPISKAPALARAMGVDQRHFLRIVMQEYMPEVWNALEEVLQDNERLMLSEDEKILIQIARSTSGNTPLALTDANNAELIARAIKAVADNEEAEREAVRELVESLPRNSALRKSGAKS